MLWRSNVSDEKKREILLTYSFDEVKGDHDLIMTLLQLCKNYYNLEHTMCENDHKRYYNKLKSR